MCGEIVKDQSLADWDRHCAELEASQEQDDVESIPDPIKEVEEYETKNLTHHAYPMSATAAGLFEFGRSMSMEYLR